jgi:5-methylcytosine-specific restriction endonuclease McrA
LSISKFGIYFCGKDCKNFAQSFKGSDPNIRPAHFRKEQDLVKCKHCGSGIRKNNSLYCSNECRGKEKIKEVKQKMNNGERIIAGTARKILITERGHRCEGCSNTHWLNKIIPLDMHHIDGNHLNNKEENLQLLCKNCHALTETYGSKNLGNGRYKRRIKFIEDKLKNSLA